MDESDQSWTPYELDDLDLIWNQAADYGADGEAPESTPEGVVKLSHVLRVYNSAMGGGLSFAVEVNEPFRIQQAIAALQFFGLSQLADLMADILDHGLDGGYAESRQAEFSTLLGPLDGAIDAAFRLKARKDPPEFGIN